MARVVIERVKGAHLDEPAGVHHRRPVTDLSDHRKVVRHQHERKAQVIGQLGQQLEDLPWTITSRAVVGSSASSTRGLQASAIAMAARWRMPPENSCG